MKILPPRFQDLFGSKYGRLLAIDFVGVKNKKKQFASTNVLSAKSQQTTG